MGFAGCAAGAHGAGAHERVWPANTSHARERYRTRNRARFLAAGVVVLGGVVLALDSKDHAWANVLESAAVFGVVLADFMPAALCAQRTGPVRLNGDGYS